MERNENIKGERVGHKPGSVPQDEPGGELSLWDDCYQTPLADGHGEPPAIGTGERPTVVPATLLPTGVYRASTSRYSWCALTTPLHPYLWMSHRNVISHRRYVSVALSSRSPALDLHQQSGLWGARTFLDTNHRHAAIAPQPPAPTLPWVPV